MAAERGYPASAAGGIVLSRHRSSLLAPLPRLFLALALMPAAPVAPAAQAARGLRKEEVPSWLGARMGEYRQKYALSCEIALTRLGLAIMGIETGEDDILSTIPRSGTDPEKAFVCDDISGGRRMNGVIHWNNYGAHPPVVVAELRRRLEAAGAAGRYEAVELSASDGELRALVKEDPRFLGAILWLVGHPERWGRRPPVNERGMVLGEHVRFLEPRLAANGDFRIWDPENGKLLVSPEAGAARDLFRDRVVALFRKD
jgi:hypothetical protein